MVLTNNALRRRAPQWHERKPLPARTSRKRLQKRKQARSEPEPKAKTKKATAKKATAKKATATKKQPAKAAKKAKAKTEAATGKRTHIAAHISEDLKAAVTEIAEAKGMSNSAYLRDLIERDAKNAARRQTKAGKKLSKALKAVTAD